MSKTVPMDYCEWTISIIGVVLKAKTEELSKKLDSTLDKSALAVGFSMEKTT